MDEQLRTLERAARAAPDDRTAGWALVRGLERTGDAVGAWRETCRLARAGDDAAWEALEWRPCAARAEGERVERRLRGGIELVSAGPGEVVLSSRSELLALDPGTLATLWSRPIDRAPRAPACASGPWVTHLEGGETEPMIVVTTRRTGEERLRLATAGAAALVSVVWADVTADLLGVLARSAADPAGGWCHAVLSLTEGLSRLHQADLADPVLPPVLARDLLLEKLPLAPGPSPSGFTPTGWAARSLDGQERWRADGALFGRQGRGVLLARPGREGRLELRELDLAGRTRWSRDVPSCRAHLGPDHVVLAEEPYRRGGETVLRLSTLERGTGTPGWERVLTGPSGARLAGLSVTGDVAHALIESRTSAGSTSAPATVQAIDVRSGLTLWTAEVPLVGSRASVHAIERGLLVVEQAIGDGDTVLHRLGAP